MINKKEKHENILSDYRILDLTDDRGFYCGKVLADLGADVIKIEPPGGDPSRNTGPFYKDIPHPEKSLYWWAYNTSKRGITLNIETAEGADIFRRLVKTADIVVESFPPDYMENLGLGYPVLSEINPGIIMTSITAFGQTGPYKDWKAPDLVGCSLGGQSYVTGDDDRPPCRIGYPQAYLHAGNQAASGTLAALYYREVSGEGQHVDVSMQESVAWTLMNVIQFWDLMTFNMFRGGSTRMMGTPRFRVAFPCKDGFVAFLIAGGQLASISMPALIQWMAEENRLGAFEDIKDWGAKDWAEKVDAWAMTQDQVDPWENSLIDFFADKTKAELYEQAMKRRIILYPVSNTKDLAENIQLRERDFWVQVEHLELGETITYAGAPYRMTGTGWNISRRAPLIGEHNLEIYKGELGFSDDEMRLLKETGAI
ncbi:MAG: CoA transferase [Dehalococcoidia bacterium]|nr:MAG: CoA transferase [Dehalococcoidia bacterium]